MMPVITSWTQGAWVALDILLVALLIYQVLVMIRGTRAAPMLVGLVVVAVIFYLARIGELTTLNWVVSHVLPYLVFALIVVFQSEIRHVLADLGRRLTFLGGSSAGQRFLRRHRAGRQSFFPAPDRRTDRDRARDRTAHPHRKRRAPRRPPLLRSAGHNFPSQRSACTTAPSSCRKIASPPPPVSFRFR